MRNQSFCQTVVVWVDGCTVEWFGTSVNLQKSDGLSSLHLGEVFTQHRHEGFSIDDLVVVACFDNGLRSVGCHPGNPFQYIDVRMEHIDASLSDGGRNGVLQSGFQFPLRQFTLVGAKPQSDRIHFEDLLEGILQSQGKPNSSAMTTGNVWQFHQTATRHAICVSPGSIDHGPIQRSIRRLFKQFGNRMNQIPPSGSVGDGQQGNFVFMNPLPE